MAVKRDPAAFRQLEATLLEEIADLSGQIRNLMIQKDAAEQLLLKARQQSELVKRTDVTRKNSVSRILVEGSISQSLQRANGAVSAWSLYKDASLMVPRLKENTFRSHLFRMKKRGVIESAGTGHWQARHRTGAGQHEAPLNDVKQT
ncbi:MAG TPA: hypothetical protein VH206_07370 [Xanthobacteraceae bacterium]|jgi:hypothetical protein|nr:hypothetical protein [Xanthobacteraceae bacterium]